MIFWWHTQASRRRTNSFHETEFGVGGYTTIICRQKEPLPKRDMCNHWKIHRGREKKVGGGKIVENGTTKLSFNIQDDKAEKDDDHHQMTTKEFDCSLDRQKKTCSSKFKNDTYLDVFVVHCSCQVQEFRWCLDYVELFRTGKIHCR